MAEAADELIVEQYKQIKDAMSATRERMHKMTLAGLASLPALVFFKFGDMGDAWRDASELFIAGLPIMLFAFGMSYRSERSAISRYGAYIERYIDPVMSCDENRIPFRGWESFTKFPTDDDRIAFGKYISQKHNISTAYEKFRALSFECVLFLYASVSAVASSRAICLKLNQPDWTYWAVALEIVAFCTIWFLASRIIDKSFTDQWKFKPSNPSTSLDLPIL